MNFGDLYRRCFTTATLMLEANVNPRVVQEVLGHANIMQTMETYSHVLPKMQQQAAERMDAMLGSKVPTDTLTAQAS